MNVVIPARNVVVYTTFNLAHDDPGIIVEVEQQPTPEGQRSSLKQLAWNCAIAPIQCDALEGAALAIVDELMHELTEKRT